MAERARVSRRRFLGGASFALGGLTGLGAALRAIGGTLPSSAAGAYRPVDLGPLAGFPEGRFVVATFLSDPEAGEVSRRAAYVRNNGLVGNRPSFTIMSSRCTHVGCPTQPNGPLLSRQQKVERGATGEVGLVPTLTVAGFGCPCRGSQSTRRATARPVPPSLADAGATAKVHRFGRLGTGEPATGPQSLSTRPTRSRRAGARVSAWRRRPRGSVGRV